MTKEQFDRERDYGAATGVAKSLLIAGLITEREFKKLTSTFKKKYNPIIGGFTRNNS
ncbi:hypothetical protein FACS18949_16390 [Clostridia bacterium]|nr:hypothetical protein FACS189425_09050 [Clostridia bacterium]GHV36706.1 hypothetical protein FACS18949_16390 [Clostridia bacterium]